MDLYNDSHEKVCILSGIKETCITSTLKTGDKEITFEFRKTNRYATDIKEEGYIRTDTDEFVIKQVEPSGEWYKCTGTLNVEELEGKQYPQGFETVEKTVDECLTEAIDGTGWKVIRCDVSKKRTIRIEQNCSAWDVAQQAITTYRCEMVFDSLNKGISVYEKYGEDRGAYFIERLNLKRLQVQSNSYDFATRLIPIGKDGLMLNIDGKNYVENHQYSKKVKTMTWKDERYTDAESLKEDAEAKLDELSKPYRSYTAEIINLVEAVQDEEKKEQYKEVFSLLLINGVYHVKAVPPYNSTGAGYTNTGLTPSGTSGGYCSRMEMASDIGRIPTVASGSETTYECDGLWFNNTIVAVALFGGSRGYGSKCGLSCWHVNNPATRVYADFVASLSCKPPVAAA